MTGAVKDIGTARIAVSNFLGGLVPNPCLLFLCYRLRDWDSRGNKIVNFTIRVVGSSPMPP